MRVLHVALHGLTEELTEVRPESVQLLRIRRTKSALSRPVERYHPGRADSVTILRKTASPTSPISHRRHLQNVRLTAAVHGCHMHLESSDLCDIVAFANRHLISKAKPALACRLRQNCGSLVFEPNLRLAVHIETSHKSDDRTLCSHPPQNRERHRGI